MPHVDKAPNAGGKRCVCMSKTGVSVTMRTVSRRTSSMRVSGVLSDEGCGGSVNKGLPVIAGIGPAVVRHQRRPTWATRILIVPVVAQFAIEIRIFRQLVSVEPHAESWTVRHSNRASVVLQLSPLDDVVHQMVIMSIGGERQVRHNRAEVKHRGQLDS